MEGDTPVGKVGDGPWSIDVCSTEVMSIILEKNRHRVHREGVPGTFQASPYSNNMKRPTDKQVMLSSTKQSFM